MKRFALSVLLLFGAFGTLTQAQTTVQLTVPVGSPYGYCGTITSEIVDGVPYNLSPWTGMSIYLSVNGTTCNNFDGGMLIELPPQPYFPDYQAWVYYQPTASQIQRGNKVLVSGTHYQEVDTFVLPFQTPFDFVYYNVTWAGSVTRQLQKGQRCYRGHCSTTWTDLSDAMILSGTITTSE